VKLATGFVTNTIVRFKFFTISEGVSKSLGEYEWK
jgi:hypothetical protein